MATREGDLEVELTDADLVDVDGGDDERQDAADRRERESRLHAADIVDQLEHFDQQLRRDARQAEAELIDAADRQLRDRDLAATWDDVGGEG